MTIKDLEKEIKQEAREEIVSGIEKYMDKLYSKGFYHDCRVLEIILVMIEEGEI